VSSCASTTALIPESALGDYLIAATAEVQGFELATLNVKHFPMFQGLRPPFTLG